MARTIQIDPVTRIEGHARVEVELEGDRVTRSLFKVLDFRGFEAFLTGMQVETMPTVTSRICGTCPVSHHLTSARAVDKVFDVTPPRAAWLLRNVLNLGAILSSHGVHFFALAGPDLLLGVDAPPEERNIMTLLAKSPDVAKQGLRLRSIGAKISEAVGGRATHPVSAVVGGMAQPLSPERHTKLLALVEEAVELATQLFDFAKPALLAQAERMTSLPLETHYLGTARNGTLDLYEGDLVLRAPDGGTQSFVEDHWTQHLHEEAVSTSYGKNVYCSIGGSTNTFRVGALARINAVDRISTPRAQAELEAFREQWGMPCHQTVMYHMARLIELLYAAERLAELVRDPELVSTDVCAVPTATPRSACAHLEAPRGVLIHDFQVDSSGIVTAANLLVATQQNLPAINATIGLAAQRYMDQPDEVLLNEIEFSIRCYDPCLSCATHRLGAMKLEVEIRQGGVPVRTLRRR